MHWLNSFMDKFYAFWQKVRPGFAAVGRVFRAIGKVFYYIGLWIYRLRSIFLSVPVALAAFVLATMNMRRLPETVEVTKMTINTKSEEALFGFLELSTTTISRGLAVNIPLILTAICLVMMLCSKRAMYPFVIAVFTLLLPIALYFFAVFPA